MATVVPYLLAAGTIYDIYSGIQAQNQAQQAQQALQRQQERAEREAEEIRQMLLPLLAPNFSAVPQSAIEAVVRNAAQDLERQQRRAEERALRNIARRGLAGSSLVEQQNAAIGERAAEALSDARLRAEELARERTLGVQSQARSLLAGLTGQNLAGARSAAQSLLTSAANQADFSARLAGQLIAPYLEQYLFPQPVSTSPAAAAPGTFRLRPPPITWPY